MELYESLMTDDWLLGTGVAPAFYESDTVPDDGLIIKPCIQVSSNSGIDLLSKAYEYEDEGLGVDLDWLDNRIDFSLLDGLELLKDEPPQEPTPPPVKKDVGHLSEFQTAAIDLLESLMVENNSEQEISYTTLTPKIISPSSQPLEIVSLHDQVLPDSPISLDDSMISVAGSMILSEDMIINPQWDGSCPMTPEEVDSLLSSPPVSPDDSLHSSDSEWMPYEEPKKARDKPYSRPTEKCEVATATPKVKGFDAKTKKERKKVQNKNAATRYRQKKKSEADVTSSDFDVLNDRNIELKRKVEEMDHEIQYMKGILKDIYKVKGLITEWVLIILLVYLACVFHFIIWCILCALDTCSELNLLRTSKSIAWEHLCTIITPK